MLARMMDKQTVKNLENRLLHSALFLHFKFVAHAPNGFRLHWSETPSSFPAGA